MVQEKSLSTSKTSSSVHDYQDMKSPGRRWCVKYVGGEGFFLTDDERKYFLTQIKGGAKVVQVGPLTLTNRFSYIYPTKSEHPHIWATGEDGKGYCECGAVNPYWNAARA